MFREKKKKTLALLSNEKKLRGNNCQGVKVGKLHDSRTTNPGRKNSLLRGTCSRIAVLGGMKKNLYVGIRLRGEEMLTCPVGGGFCKIARGDGPRRKIVVIKLKEREQCGVGRC